MSITNEENFSDSAKRCREHIIRMSSRGGCFLGASLSCVDIILFLYKSFLYIDKANLDNPKRDYFLLSKGHDVPALYSVLAEEGILSTSLLQRHLEKESNIYWHPNMTIPGVEFHSGSLGHGLPIAIGIAYHLKIKKLTNRVVVLIGDGEMNEGSVWEAILVANAKCLDNLLLIVDRNEFQANIKTENLIPLESIEKKLSSFGWSTVRIDGHNYQEIYDALGRFPVIGKPMAIIADTVRGKGLPSIEKDPARWFVSISKTEAEDLISELHGGKRAILKSDSLFVR